MRNQVLELKNNLFSCTKKNGKLSILEHQVFLSVSITKNISSASRSESILIFQYVPSSELPFAKTR